VTVIPSLLAWLTHTAEPWQHLYSHSTPVSVTVLFLHLGALLVAGGLAIAADRDTLRLRADDAAGRERHLESMESTHGVVIGGLALVFISGVLLFLSDVEVFSTSLVFWAKLTLVAMLLANGFLMTRVEQSLRRAEESGVTNVASGARLWQRRRATALGSIALWFAVVFVGVVLSSR
jgi:uncharacterized membrane protein